MATCKDCFHYEACSGFKPTDLDKNVWHYCQMGIPEEIPDVDQRCDSFKDSKSWREVVRCKDCKYGIWDEEEKLWECVVGADDTGDADTYAMFHEYNEAEHFCSYGERRC